MAKGHADPTVVLVGRPNVGKSTLFNRITGARRSIVAPVAGTTRDVLAAPAEWQRRRFRLVDTGGLFGATTDPLHELVVARGLGALESGDLIVFVVDGREGLVPADQEIVARLRVLGRPVLVAINKADDKAVRSGAMDFYRLGFDPVFEVSAEHGDGVAELLDEIVRRLPDVAQHAEPDDEPDGETRVTIIGRPNVGKSSLVNRLVRAERAMVSEMPGTTRDSVEAELQWKRRRFRIVDTAGMRRPGKVTGGVENVSVVMARRAMADADVAVLVVDAAAGIGDRDAAIIGEAVDVGCSVVIAVNKWDLVKERGVDVSREIDEAIRDRLKFADYAPIVHLSALTGERVSRLIQVVDRVTDARQKRVPTGELNRLIESATAANPPTSAGRRAVRILYAAQIGTRPPTFVMFTNVSTTLHFSYERFLTNRLREAFGFEGTPIRLAVRRRGKVRERATSRGARRR